MSLSLCLLHKYTFIFVLTWLLEKISYDYHATTSRDQMMHQVLLLLLLLLGTAWVWWLVSWALLFWRRSLSLFFFSAAGASDPSSPPAALLQPSPLALSPLHSSIMSSSSCKSSRFTSSKNSATSMLPWYLGSKMVAFLRRSWISGGLYFSVNTLHMFSFIFAVNVVSLGFGDKSLPLRSYNTGFTEDIVTYFSTETMSVKSATGFIAALIDSNTENPARLGWGGHVFCLQPGHVWLGVAPVPSLSFFTCCPILWRHPVWKITFFFH